MKKTGIRAFHELNILLAIMLCILFTCFLPATVKATPTSDKVSEVSVDNTLDSSQILFAGETSSNEPEGMLRINRNILLPALHIVLQTLYPQTNLLSNSPHSYPASKGDCGLHTILTKGP